MKTARFFNETGNHRFWGRMGPTRFKGFKVKGERSKNKKELGK